MLTHTCEFIRWDGIGKAHFVHGKVTDYCLRNPNSSVTNTHDQGTNKTTVNDCHGYRSVRKTIAKHEL